jgi:hypothetical protein
MLDCIASCVVTSCCNRVSTAEPPAARPAWASNALILMTGPTICSFPMKLGAGGGGGPDGVLVDGSGSGSGSGSGAIPHHVSPCPSHVFLSVASVVQPLDETHCLLAVHSAPDWAQAQAQAPVLV